MREVLERDLSRLEWEWRIALRAADLRSGRVAPVPLEAVERDLGLDGVEVDPDVLDDIE